MSVTEDNPRLLVLATVVSRMTVFWDMTPSSLVKVGLTVKVRVEQTDKEKAKGCAMNHSEAEVARCAYCSTLKKLSPKCQYGVISQKRRASAKERISGQSDSLHMLHRARCHTLAHSVIAVGGMCCSVTQ